MSDNSDNQTSGSAARLARDVVIYTAARIALVVALTAAIYYIAQLIGIREFPLVVALLFAIVIALPLGIWVLAPLRKRATASIAAVDERRRRDREQLQARLRGSGGSKGPGGSEGRSEATRERGSEGRSEATRERGSSEATRERGSSEASRKKPNKPSD